MCAHSIECMRRETTEMKDDNERDENERDAYSKKCRFERKWNSGRVLSLFCAGVLGLCSTEVESFVLIESSYSVDFALQFGKVWNRIFVGREFCNTFVLIGDSGFCFSVKKSLQRTNPSFPSNQLHKSFRLIADYLLSRNKIKLDTILFQRRYSGYLAQLVL